MSLLNTFAPWRPHGKSTECERIRTELRWGRLIVFNCWRNHFLEEIFQCLFSIFLKKLIFKKKSREKIRNLIFQNRRPMSPLSVYPGQSARKVGTPWPLYIVCGCYVFCVLLVIYAPLLFWCAVSGQSLEAITCLCMLSLTLACVFFGSFS